MSSQPHLTAFTTALALFAWMPLAASAAPPALDTLLAEEAALLARPEVALPDQRRSLASLRARIAEAHLAANQPERAVDYLLSSVRLDPAHADRLERLGDLLPLLPAPAASGLRAACYGDAVDLAPDDRELRTKAARAYQATGELDAARRHLEILVRNSGGSPDGGPLQDLAMTYLALDDPQAGVRFLEPLVAADAGPHFLLHLAILTRATGDLPGARGHLRTLVSSAAPDLLVQHARDLDRHYAELEEEEQP